MEELYNLGLSENSIKFMLEINPYFDKDDLLDKINILLQIGCSNEQITNIISSNSLFLNRTNGEIIELISYLKKIGFTMLNILFDSNPYILNLEVFEIKNYISDRINMGEKPDEVIDDLESNCYIFNEI